jgi:hypothetical protein
MKESLISAEFIALTEGGRLKSSLIGRKRVLQMYAMGGLFLDLLIDDIIGMDEKKKIVIRDQNPHIEHEAAKMLFALIKNEKPRTFRRWMGKFNIPSKERVSIFSAFDHDSKSIADLQRNTVEKLRAELLEEGPVNEETIALTMMLSASKTIMDYFSKYEINQLKERIREFQNEHPARWKTIQSINKEIEYMDLIILTSIIAV